MRWGSRVRGGWSSASGRTWGCVIWRVDSGPDNWALSAFRRRHGRALNDLFTQGVEMARELGLGRRRPAELPRRLERLRKSGETRLSRRDGEARFLRERGGFALGYTAEIAVSEDHLIVAQRVTLNRCDVPTLVPLVEEVEQRTGERPERALADAGFYSNENVRDLEERGLEVYVPDPNLARELNTGKRARTIGRNRVRSPELKAMRQKLRSPAGRRV